MKKYSLFILSAVLVVQLSAQKKPAQDWHFSKPKKKNMGISVYEAYKTPQAQVPSKTIVVAVIDGGTDVNHEDLKDVIWKNPKEIAGNKLDDDNNGYIDDVYGWNFIGGADGSNVGADNLEKVRVFKKMSLKYETGTWDVSDEGYQKYLSMKEEIQAGNESGKTQLKQFKTILDALKSIQKATKSDNPSPEEMMNVQTEDPLIKGMAANIAKSLKKDKIQFIDVYNQFNELVKGLDTRVNYQNNPDFDSRKIVGDDYANSSERIYGNNDVIGPDASHGTHVAGIIAAKRDNNLGMNGIADNVKIMVVRVVPDGDERDKDVANGIRYAVDNGAKIINMSFGKGFSWDKNIVDSAVAYAEAKGVLLVHAAGNSGQNNDETSNYPNDTLWGGKRFAANWLEIGASQAKRKILPTDFSNYGKNNVDVFSPGWQIYSTIPNNGYAYFDGTSMASPVAAGVAAFVWSRYPNLTAVQMKEILMSSSLKLTKKVIRPGTEKEKVVFTDLSVSGGLINAKAAIEMAAKMSGK